MSGRNVRKTMGRAELGLREINHRQPPTTFRDHGAGLQGSHRGPKAASPQLRQVPTHTPSPGPNQDQASAAHLKSSRISRLSAWKGMFRTRILEVVCFLGTCFFRADVRAGLEGGGGAGHLGVGSCCRTLTQPPSPQTKAGLPFRRGS